ncbi:MAG: amidohydrolase [Firmicutes bacterium]|nr:amidohydrolase [Bacillota bacterium]
MSTPQPIVFENVEVVTVTARGVLRGGTVVVEGGRITRVAAAGEPVERPAGARVVRGPDRALCPGHVNLHNHAAMTLFRGWADDMNLMPWLETKIWPAEARLTGEDVYWGTLLCLAEMLRAGTTTFADMYFFEDEVARAVAESGMRAVLSVGLLDADGGGERRLREGVDFVRRWHGAAGGRIRAMLGPHAPYTCSLAYLKEIVAASKELDCAIHIHLHETRGEVERHAALHGCSPIQSLAGLGLFERPVLAAHCVHVSEEDIAVLAQMRGGVSHNPLSNLKLASGIAPVARLLEAGVPLGLGTDGPTSTNQMGLWEEMRLCSWLAKVSTGDGAAVPAARSLELGTRGGAEVLGWPELGRIEEGAAADLILVDLSSPRFAPLHDVVSALVYGTQDADVEMVLVGGEVVVEGGRCTRLDEERIRHEVARRVPRLVAGL